MENPFKFGKVIEPEYFFNRDNEKKRLISNIENRIHTTLISPGRWGKSSLVKNTSYSFA